MKMGRSAPYPRTISASPQRDPHPKAFFIVDMTMETPRATLGAVNMHRAEDVMSYALLPPVGARPESAREREARLEEEMWAVKAQSWRLRMAEAIALRD